MYFLQKKEKGKKSHTLEKAKPAAGNTHNCRRGSAPSLRLHRAVGAARFRSGGGGRGAGFLPIPSESFLFGVAGGRAARWAGSLPFRLAPPSPLEIYFFK